MFTSKLAELFVEFTTRGVKEIQTALGQVHENLKQVQSGAEQVGRVAIRAFGVASLALGGFVKAGVSASAIGEVLRFEMDRLSRTIAGLFRPEIEAVITAVRSATDWFRNLTDQQRENIVQWVKAAAAGLAVAIIIPKIIAGVAALTAGLRALTVAMASTGIGAILPILGAVATAMAGIAVGTEVAENGFGGLFAALKPVFDTFMQFATQIAEAFKPVLDVVVNVFKAIWQAIQPVIPALMEMVTLIGGALAQAVVALQPAILAIVEAFSGIMQALAPLLPIVGQLIASFVQALTPVLQLVAGLLTGLMKILEPVITLFVKVAEVVLKIVKPALDAVAFVLDKVARALAFLFGIDLDKQKKAVEGMAEATKKMAEGARTELTPKSFGFESLSAAYDRIAIAGMKATAGMGKSPAERQVELAEDGNRELGRIRAAVEGGKLLWVK